MKAIMEDSSLSATEKITKMYELIKDLPAEEVQKILDAAKEKGIIDEETYNKLSDLFNGNGKIEIPDISGDGIKDLVTKILDKLGIGGGNGGNGGDNSNGSGSGSSGSGSNKTDFEGGKAKTGDYTIASVAGIAAIAGAALVLTKKKNDDK